LRPKGKGENQMKVEVEALALQIPRVAAHPNRKPFRGVLTQVDVASDRAPSGTNGRRVVVTRTAAEKALASLIGMGIGFTPQFDGHDARRKVGVITAAEVQGNALVVEGYLFARDFPEIVREIERGVNVLGMSYEVADARVEDPNADIWKLIEVTFTGAAVLKRSKAAYQNTSIELTNFTLTEESRVENEQIDEKGMTQMFQQAMERMAAAAEAMQQSVTHIQAQHDELSARIEKIVAAVENEKFEVPMRKTLPAVAAQLLAKNGVDVSEPMDVAAIDASLASLSVEQRIAVKSQMARAGLLQ
jgi:hypothetical protein